MLGYKKKEPYSNHLQEAEKQRMEAPTILENFVSPLAKIPVK